VVACRIAVTLERREGGTRIYEVAEVYYSNKRTSWWADCLVELNRKFPIRIGVGDPSRPDMITEKAFCWMEVVATEDSTKLLVGRRSVFRETPATIFSSPPNATRSIPQIGQVPDFSRIIS
jgi:hypothetical protein